MSDLVLISSGQTELPPWERLCFTTLAQIRQDQRISSDSDLIQRLEWLILETSGFVFVLEIGDRPVVEAINELERREDLVHGCELFAPTSWCNDRSVLRRIFAGKLHYRFDVAPPAAVRLPSIFESADFCHGATSNEGPEHCFIKITGSSYRAVPYLKCSKCGKIREEMEI